MWLLPLHKRPAHFDHLHLRRIQKLVGWPKSHRQHACPLFCLLCPCIPSYPCSQICVSDICSAIRIPRVSVSGDGKAYCALRLVPLAVCPAVGGGYDAIICQEFGYASAPLGRERRPLCSLCFIVYQSIVLVSTSLPKTEVPECLLSSLSVSVIGSLCALVRARFWSMLLRLYL
jgi:hypothetical protein